MRGMTSRPCSFRPPAAKKGFGSQPELHYGDNPRLKNINVPLYERMVTAFIGPSGAASPRCCAS